MQRTVLLGPTGPLEFEQVAAVEDTAPRTSSQAQTFQSFWSEYLAKLTLDEQTQPRPQNPSKSTNQFLAMPPTGASAWLSAYLAQSIGKAGVYLTFSRTFGRAGEFYDRLLAEREQIESSVGVPLEWSRDGNKVYIAAPDVKIDDLTTPERRQPVVLALADMTNRFVNTFRHRLDAFSREAAS